jgi:hypothetical protein
MLKSTMSSHCRPSQRYKTPSRSLSIIIQQHHIERSTSNNIRDNLFKDKHNIMANSSSGSGDKSYTASHGYGGGDGKPTSYDYSTSDVKYTELKESK